MVKISLFMSMIGTFLPSYSNNNIEPILARQNFYKISRKGFKNKPISFLATQNTDNNEVVTYYGNYGILVKKGDCTSKKLGFSKNELANAFNKEPQLSCFTEFTTCICKGIPYVYLKKKKCKKSISFNGQFGNSNALLISYMSFVNLYNIPFKKKVALLLYQEAWSLTRNIKKGLVLIIAYMNTVIKKVKIFNTKAALYYYKNQKEIEDDLNNRMGTGELIIEQKKIELSQKNTQISLLGISSLDKKSRFNNQENFCILLIVSNTVLLLVLCLVIYFYKITLIKKKIIRVQNKSLNSLSKFKDELISVLAHDLRSPTHRLIEITDQMKIELQEGNVDKLRELIRLGSNTANKTYLLLDNLLHWILLHNNSVFFIKENINLSCLLNQVLHVFLPFLEIKQIQFEAEIPEQAEVYGDVNSLKVVLRNLIDNAIKFTPNRGRINIKTRQSNNNVILSITDTGIGMDDIILNGLYDSPIKTTTIKKGKNNGLGLQLCFSFIKKNEGVLTIKSEVNIGTTVFVKLPCSIHTNHGKD